MASTGPVEKKVAASSVAAFLGSTGLLAVLTALQDNTGLVGGLPDALEPFVLGAIPTAITFVGGWVTRHTPRADTTTVR